MRVFLDTNVFLRFLTQDEKIGYEESLRLITKIQSGELTPYTSGIVFLELNYVLTKIYKKKKADVVDAILKLLQIRNLTLVEKVDTKAALDLYKKHDIKLGDCFIASQVPAGVVLVTYDKHFRKIKRFKTLTPAEC